MLFLSDLESATRVKVTPTGGISSTNVQAALAELDSEKAASSHTHTIANVTSLQTTLDGKAPLSHVHAITDVTNLQTTLNGKAASVHTHAIADISALQTALDGKAAAVHSHVIADITNLQTTLDGKAASSHTHSYLPLGGGNLTGLLNLQDNTLQRPLIQDYAETTTIRTGVTGATTCDLATSNVYDDTLSGAATYTFSNPPASGRSGSLTLTIRQPATAVAITWPAGVKWSGGEAPAMGDAEVWVCSFITRNAGTEWLGVSAGPFS